MTWQALDGALDSIWSHLKRGGADRRSEFRWMQVATASADGAPECRTVVLRRAVQSERVLVFHSDVRAGKIQAFARDARVQLHIHAQSASLQIRIDATVKVHSGDDAIAEQEWGRLHDGARAPYSVSTPPGLEVRTADAALFNAEARLNFATCRATVSRVEWLHLGREGHRRAAHLWTGDDWSGAWLVP